MKDTSFFSDCRQAVMHSCYIESIRSFLSAYNLVEVHSPILSPVLIPERHIDVYAVEEEEQGKMHYLTPSPEVYLKQMIAKLSHDETMNTYMGGVYELTHSFRKTEQKSPIHQKEFLMLEYYCLHTSTQQMQDITVDMLQHCIQCMIKKNKTLHLFTQESIAYMQHLLEHVLSMSLEQAFFSYTAFNYNDFLQCKSTVEAMVCVGLDPMKDIGMDWEDIFHYALVQYLEPMLPRDHIIFLYDYPSKVKTLSKTKAAKQGGIPCSDRWELYIAGIEVANCFNEETDPDSIFSFMQEQATLGGARNIQADWDKNFLRSDRLPQCSGGAMGIDRVYMALLGKQSLYEATSLHESLYIS